MCAGEIQWWCIVAVLLGSGVAAGNRKVIGIGIVVHLTIHIPLPADFL